MRKIGGTVAGLGAIIGLAVLIARWAIAPDTAVESGTATLADRAAAAAKARIAMESRGTVPGTVSVARPSAAPLPAAVPAAVPEVGAAPPNPPEGYSFVEHGGEMATAPLEARFDDRLDEGEPGLEWIDSASALDALIEQAERAGRDWTFGWVRLAGGVLPDGVAPALRELGAEVLGSSGRLLRARLPGDRERLRAIGALEGVGALGALPVEAKLLVESSGPPHEEVPVFINLMTGDPDGRWRRQLEAMGAAVGHYDGDIRAYAANAAYGILGAIAASDFVLAVEPVRSVEAAHDTAVPAMGADALRVWQSQGMFSGGGASVPVGVMDSGLNVNHLDIGSNRGSICGANFVSAGRRLNDGDLWTDRNGHGTHVTGTILGNGFVDARFAGVAPSVGHVRFAKVLDGGGGTGETDSIVRGMDFLSRPTSCGDAGAPGIGVRPLIVNMSLSVHGRDFRGRSADVRKLDSVAWSHRQLYVTAQGNAAEEAFSNTGAAKNALSVGAVRDGGDLAFFSSHGPTADGRLAPQVVATGVDIRSPAGAGSRAGYHSASGTSSASPAVAGVAALLMDASPAFRRLPALVRARLMASAVKPDPWLDAPERFPANNTAGPGALNAQYGLGKASARTAVLNRDRPDGWVNGSATSELRNGVYAHRDIVVPEGASRLDLVMTWDEPPADTIVTEVLNDLDLWLDRDGDCGQAACGEYSSRSRRDNVEWIVVRNPPPGVYRAKVLPRRIYTAAPRAAVAWTVIRGDSTPTLRIDADEQGLASGGGALKLRLSTDAYVAAGTRLRVACRAVADADCDGVRLKYLKRSREDRVPARTSDWALGTHLALGEIGVGETQSVDFIVEYDADGDGAVLLYFTATAWNAGAAVFPVALGAAGPETPLAGPLSNDDFAHARVLEGAKGSAQVDLLGTGTEPGEPTVERAAGAGRASTGSDSSAAQATVPEPARGRPAGSAWFAWTAPSDGPYRFAVGPGPLGAEPVYVDVYRGEAIAALERIEPKPPENGHFFAEEGSTYRVRVSNGTRLSAGFGRPAQAMLGWSPASRPANDDFALGARIEGAAGSIRGGNRGATLESGEWFGQFAATVWYRWTAPEDGGARFEVDNGATVMAFAGERVDALRLVSQRPGPHASFPVRAGQEYRIAVAAGSAYDAGVDFELVWRETTRAGLNEDGFGGAKRLDGAASGSHGIHVGAYATVQPGEPAETGVRTNWWAWTAPADGVWTWRLEDPSQSGLRVAAFSGDTLENLRLAGSTATSFEFAFAAGKDGTYRFSVGVSADDAGAFERDYEGQGLVWGPTPANDALAGALPLAGGAGSVSGSNLFATVEAGEPVLGPGHSSVWWTYEAPGEGWYRFHLDGTDPPFALAVYRVAGDGSLEQIGASHRLGAATAAEVLFHAVAGVRYRIRLGALGEAPGGEFTMRWEETGAPAWLKYAGRLVDGDTDGNGRPVHLGRVSGLAFNDDGSVLYAASSTALHTFERDPGTGKLSVAHTLAEPLDGMSLIFVARRQRLHAHDCVRWGTFSLVGGAPAADRRIDGAGSGVACRGFMDSGGASLYVIQLDSGIDVYDIAADGARQRVESVAVPGIRNAAIASDDAHVYAVTDRALIVFERDSGTGRLREARAAELAPGESSPGAVTVGDDGGLLFVTESFAPQHVAVFDIGADPLAPPRLGSTALSGSWRGPGDSQGCGFAAPRRGTPAIDLFCDGSAHAVQYNASSGRLVESDVIRRIDRFDNVLPESGPARSLAPSPDGRHAYVAAEHGGILIFERLGSGRDTAPGGGFAERTVERR